MKTLIFNGSPRKNGDTVSLINELKSKINGEVKVVSSYYDNIKPCIDCRHCWKSASCTIDDYMTQIYKYIADCDNIVIASPLYFSEITGSLLSALSRLQMIWAARHFRHEELITKSKKGAVIICGGGEGDPTKAESTAKVLLTQMNARDDYVGSVFSHNTNNLPSKDDTIAIAQIQKLAQLLND